MTYPNTNCNPSDKLSKTILTNGSENRSHSSEDLPTSIDSQATHERSEDQTNDGSFLGEPSRSSGQEAIGNAAKNSEKTLKSATSENSETQSQQGLEVSATPPLNGVYNTGGLTLSSEKQFSPFRYSANFKVINKEGANQLSYVGAWKTVSGGFSDLSAHISKGHPYLPAVLDDGKPRRSIFANYAEILAIDIDSGLTIDQAIALPFVQSHCGLIQPSASHTPEHHKFRLVFRLHTPIQGSENIKSAYTYLQSFFNSLADEACKDASRYYFGALGSVAVHLNESAVLPSTFLEDATAWKLEKDRKSQEEYEAARSNRADFDYELTDDEALNLVKEALRYIPGRGQRGGGRYNEALKVLVVLKTRFGDAVASQLAEQWSPTDVRNGWNIDEILKSLKGSNKNAESAIGFIVNRAKENGFIVPKASQDQRKRAADRAIKVDKKVVANISVKLPDLGNLDISDVPTTGIVVIDSHKIQGVGKTNLLENLTKDSPKALSLTHRVSLGKGLGTRLGMAYRTNAKRAGRSFDEDRMIACLESWRNIDVDRYVDGDLILDEASQFLFHVLTADTLKGDRPLALEKMIAAVRNAKRVLLADADMKETVVNWVKALRKEKKAFYIHNRHKRQGFKVTIVNSRTVDAIQRLILKATEAKSKGEIIYIASDSKKQTDVMKGLLQDVIEELKSKGFKVLIINADTSMGEEAQAFSSDPDGYLERTEVDVIVASPSLSTGVSITSAKIIEVFGIFTGGSFDSADILQSLNRVRRPVPRTVWVVEKAFRHAKCPISTSTNAQEIKEVLKQRFNGEISVIRNELRQAYIDPSELFSWDEDPNLNAYCELWAERNADLANLKARVVARLEFAGNTVTFTDGGDDKEIQEFRAEINEANRLITEAKMLSARVLTEFEAKQLERCETLTEDDRFALKRYHLAEAYAIEDTHKNDNISLDLATSENSETQSQQGLEVSATPPLNGVYNTGGLTLGDRKIYAVSETLIKFDSNGDTRRQIAALEDLLESKATVVKSANHISRYNKADAAFTPWDVRPIAYQTSLRKLLGLLDFLTNPNKKWTQADYSEYAAKVRSLAGEIKNVLNFTVQEKHSDIAIVNSLLLQVGIKMTRKRKGKQGKDSFYVLDQAHQLEMQAIIERRIARRKAKEQAIDTAARNEAHTRAFKAAKTLSLSFDDFTDLKDLVASTKADSEALEMLKGNVVPLALWDDLLLATA